MKNRIRKERLSLRKSMTETIIKQYSEHITQKVIRHPDYKAADLVFCYVDVKNEVKTAGIIENAWKNGKKVAVPKVHDEEMKFYLIHSYEQLEQGCFGLQEPKTECTEVSDVPKNSVVIMPGVAFDRQGNRIGYGKGYYDKYFSKYPGIFKIAIAFSLQIVPEIPFDRFDVKADCVITEEQEEIIMSKDLKIEEMIDDLMGEMYGEDYDEEYDEEAEEAEMITLTMEDGTEVPCIVLTIVEVEGQDYIALLPINEEMLESDESDGFIFRYSEDEEGLPVLEAIEDDEEFEMVGAVLDEIMEISVEEETEE